jgi:hypothetical protein
MRGFCFGTLIDLFRANPSSWPEAEDMPRQLATWRELSQQEGPPPVPFAEIWAETRCRWDSHVALAAGF